MKNTDEMVNSLLERRELYNKEHKKHKRMIIRISTSVVCCSIIFCSALMLLNLQNSGKLPVAWESNAHKVLKNKNKKPDESIVWENDENQKGVDNSATNGTCIFWWKNKLSISGTLLHAIENNPDSVFAIIATYRPAAANITSFTYEGKTLAEWAVEADDERMLPEKMSQLLKEGDSLKYGTALYQDGAPNGEKWTKELYEEKLAFYGEELLNKYIINGNFLRENLENDIANYNENSARKGYKLAYNAYMETVLTAAEKQLFANHIKCKRNTYNNNCLILFAKADELENIPLSDLGNWYFDLASDNLKGASDNEADTTGLKIVN